MERTRLKAVLELAFAALLGPTWAVFIVGLALVPRGVYVIDLYKQVGPWVWTAILVNVAATVALLHWSPRLQRLAYANLGALSLCTLAIPYSIGYFAYGRADALTVIGSIGGLMRRGNVYPENLYPGTAFLGADVGFATGLPAPVVFWVIGLAASLLLLLSLCLLIKEALPTGRPRMAFLPAFVLYCSWLQATGTPNFVFLAVAAFALYCALAFPTAIAGRLVCMMLLGAAVALGHPFVTLFLFTAYVALWLFGRSGTRTDAILTGVFIALIFALWAFTNKGFVTAVRTNLRTFRNSAVAPVAEEGAEKASVVEFGFGEWLVFIVLYLTRYIVPAMAIGFGFASVRLREWLRSQPAWAWALLIVGAVVEALLLFNPFVAHTPIRVININYAIFGLVPLAAIGLVWLARTSAGGRVLSASLVTLVIGIGVLGAFDSPRTFLPNAEFGNEEVLAARWVLTERGNYSIHNPLGVFEVRAIGLLYDVLPGDDHLRPTQGGLLADHFAEPPRDGRFPLYVALPHNDVVRYTELYPEVGRFNTTDFESLDHSPRLPRVYDSLGFRTYFYQR